MRPSHFGKSVLIASIPGAILPIVFFLLFSLNTTATPRDVLPALDDPLEAVGFCGSLIFSLPIMFTNAAVNSVILTIHERGLTIPLLDLLSPSGQSNFGAILGLLINVGLWTLPVSFFRRRKKEPLHIDNSDKEEFDSNSS